MIKLIIQIIKKHRTGFYLSLFLLFSNSSFSQVKKHLIYDYWTQTKECIDTTGGWYSLNGAPTPRDMFFFGKIRIKRHRRLIVFNYCGLYKFDYSGDTLRLKTKNGYCNYLILKLTKKEMILKDFCDLPEPPSQLYFFSNTHKKKRKKKDCRGWYYKQD